MGWPKANVVVFLKQAGGGFPLEDKGYRRTKGGGGVSGKKNLFGRERRSINAKNDGQTRQGTRALRESVSVGFGLETGK